MTQETYKVYNDEGVLVAVDIKTILELLQLNGYEVIIEEKKIKDRRDYVN